MKPGRGKSHGRRPVGSDVELDGIVDQVAAWRGVARQAIFGHGRRRPVLEARYEAIARAYATDRFSGPRLGAYFGGRYGSAILRAVSRAHEWGLL